MPANVKSADAMTKHLTKAEKSAREAAEKSCLPDRMKAMKMPKSLSGDKVGQGYWRSILKRMEGLGILDELDAEMLAVYCSSLARKDSLSALCRGLIDQADAEPDLEMRFELIANIDSVLNRLQAHEKTLLSYANVLGLTPEARARLARKRAAAEAEADPDGDLFGD